MKRFIRKCCRGVLNPTMNKKYNAQESSRLAILYKKILPIMIVITTIIGAFNTFCNSSYDLQVKTVLIFSILIGIQVSHYFAIKFKPYFFNIWQQISVLILHLLILKYVLHYYQEEIKLNNSNNYFMGHAFGILFYLFITGTNQFVRIILLVSVFLEIILFMGLSGEHISISLIVLMFFTCTIAALKIIQEEKRKQRLFLTFEQNQIWQKVIERFLPINILMIQYDENNQRIVLNSSNLFSQQNLNIFNDDDLQLFLDAASVNINQEEQNAKNSQKNVTDNNNYFNRDNSPSKKYNTNNINTNNNNRQSDSTNTYIKDIYHSLSPTKERSRSSTKKRSLINIFKSNSQYKRGKNSSISSKQQQNKNMKQNHQEKKSLKHYLKEFMIKATKDKNLNRNVYELRIEYEYENDVKLYLLKIMPFFFDQNYAIITIDNLSNEERLKYKDSILQVSNHLNNHCRQQIINNTQQIIKNFIQVQNLMNLSLNNNDLKKAKSMFEILQTSTFQMCSRNINQVKNVQTLSYSKKKVPIFSQKFSLLEEIRNILKRFSYELHRNNQKFKLFLDCNSYCQSIKSSKFSELLSEKKFNHQIHSFQNTQNQIKITQNNNNNNNNANNLNQFATFSQIEGQKLSSNRKLQIINSCNSLSLGKQICQDSATEKQKINNVNNIIIHEVGNIKLQQQNISSNDNSYENQNNNSNNLLNNSSQINNNNLNQQDKNNNQKIISDNITSSALFFLGMRQDEIINEENEKNEEQSQLNSLNNSQKFTPTNTSNNNSSTTKEKRISEYSKQQNNSNENKDNLQFQSYFNDIDQNQQMIILSQSSIEFLNIDENLNLQNKSRREQNQLQQLHQQYSYNKQNQSDSYKFINTNEKYDMSEKFRFYNESKKILSPPLTSQTHIMQQNQTSISNHPYHIPLDNINSNISSEISPPNSLLYQIQQSPLNSVIQYSLSFENNNNFNNSISNQNQNSNTYDFMNLNNSQFKGQQSLNQSYETSVQTIPLEGNQSNKFKPKKIQLKKMLSPDLYSQQQQQQQQYQQQQYNEMNDDDKLNQLQLKKQSKSQYNQLLDLKIDDSKIGIIQSNNNVQSPKMKYLELDIQQYPSQMSSQTSIRNNNINNNNNNISSNNSPINSNNNNKNSSNNNNNNNNNGLQNITSSSNSNQTSCNQLSKQSLSSQSSQQSQISSQLQQQSLSPKNSSTYNQSNYSCNTQIKQDSPLKNNHLEQDKITIKNNKKKNKLKNKNKIIHKETTTQHIHHENHSNKIKKQKNPSISSNNDSNKSEYSDTIKEDIIVNQDIGRVNNILYNFIENSIIHGNKNTEISMRIIQNPSYNIDNNKDNNKDNNNNNNNNNNEQLDSPYITIEITNISLYDIDDTKKNIEQSQEYYLHDQYLIDQIIQEEEKDFPMGLRSARKNLRYLGPFDQISYSYDIIKNQIKTSFSIYKNIDILYQDQQQQSYSNQFSQSPYSPYLNGIQHSQKHSAQLINFQSIDPTHSILQLKNCKSNQSQRNSQDKKIFQSNLFSFNFSPVKFYKNNKSGSSGGGGVQNKLNIKESNVNFINNNNGNVNYNNINNNNIFNINITNPENNNNNMNNSNILNNLQRSRCSQQSIRKRNSLLIQQDLNLSTSIQNRLKSPPQNNQGLNKSQNLDLSTDLIKRFRNNSVYNETSSQMNGMNNLSQKLQQNNQQQNYLQVQQDLTIFSNVKQRSMMNLNCNFENNNCNNISQSIQSSYHRKSAVVESKQFTTNSNQNSNKINLLSKSQQCDDYIQENNNNYANVVNNFDRDMNLLKLKLHNIQNNNKNNNNYLENSKNKESSNENNSNNNKNSLSFKHSGFLKVSHSIQQNKTDNS